MPIRPSQKMESETDEATD